MLVFPNVKINLGLNIVNKRSDGYHDIETIFYPAPLYDALEVVVAPDGQSVFKQTGIQIDGDPDDNLVMKAYRLLKSDFALPEIAVYLRKQIPFGAGLGGGSADAAFMLRLLNDFADLQLSDMQLENYAARLGADCPFFIRNQASMAHGIGNIFSPVEISLKDYWLLIVKPPVSVSTKDAYAGVSPRRPEESLDDIIRLPVGEWKGRLLNDFEVSVFAKFPAIKDVKARLYEVGALYASMSGSGSAVFGLFEKDPQTQDAFADCFYHCRRLES